MSKCEKKCYVEPVAITVVSGTSVTITLPPMFLKNGCFQNFKFCLSGPNLVAFRDLVVGTEVVTIQNGVGGTAYVMEDNDANIFYADLLCLGWCYRIKFGNNGPANSLGTAGGVAHFLNVNTPCCARRYNPANTAIPTVPVIETAGV